VRGVDHLACAEKNLQLSPPRHGGVWLCPLQRPDALAKGFATAMTAVPLAPSSVSNETSPTSVTDFDHDLHGTKRQRIHVSMAPSA